MTYQHRKTDGNQYPPSATIVYHSQQQPNAIFTGSSQNPQPYQMISQYKAPSVSYNNSFKHNKIAPPQVHDMHALNQTLPTNCKSF